MPLSAIILFLTAPLFPFFPHRAQEKEKKIKKKIQTEHFPNVAIKNYWTENFMFSYVQFCMYILDEDNSFFFSCLKKDFLLSYILKNKIFSSKCALKNKIIWMSKRQTSYHVWLFYIHAFATARSHIILISIYVNAFVRNFDVEPLWILMIALILSQNCFHIF